METYVRGFAGQNIGTGERWASLAAGVFLIGAGLSGRDKNWLLTLAGAELVRRGATGNSFLYWLIGLGPAEQSRNKPVPYKKGVRVDETITIGKSPDEIYTFWRAFENLPYFMRHLESVSLLDSRRSHWVAKTDSGNQIAWDAEIIEDKPGQMISWRSLPESEIATAGSVHFRPTYDGRGTELQVELQYYPIGGILVATLAKLFGQNPGACIAQDLRELKRILEEDQLAAESAGPQLSEEPKASAAGEHSCGEAIA